MVLICVSCHCISLFSKRSLRRLLSLCDHFDHRNDNLPVDLFFFPNEQNLRPEAFAHPNILTDIVQFIYDSDTHTNVFPSIHVFNAVAIHVALVTSPRIKKIKWLRPASLLLCSLICLSTMFLKQHSFLDVIAALLLYLLYATLIYKVIPQWKKK